MDVYGRNPDLEHSNEAARVAGAEIASAVETLKSVATMYSLITAHEAAKGKGSAGGTSDNDCYFAFETER